MTIIAVIPARGGSVGIKKKNIRNLNGKPLIAYTIEKALACKLLDRVIVSTDDDEIAKIAKKYGAEVPFLRPKELALNTTPMLPVIKHAVEYIENHEKKLIDFVVLLDPTAPFRSVDDIENCIKKLMESGADTVLTVCEAEHNPYFVMVELEDDKMVPLLRIKKTITRRQDAPKVYRINAGVYAIKRDIVMKKSTVFTKNTRVVLMPHERSVHIDHEIDLKFAEFLFKAKKKGF